MKLKLMDVLYCPVRKISGQVHKMRDEKILIKFITGEILVVLRRQIVWINNQWRING